ncbi:helix-turn-helix domain-containing protein [Aquimarina aquimarini]|uniref:helix-turn-helix domain-containing protein n=1 Tax=Aquimarina aquimarini TaxID=1191734 RepID=UPI000D55041A|nr:helix-turn-helix transcriptional regulator [Aquimarina aquimarini]
MAKDDKFKEALGNRLRSLRQDAGLTLVELAEKSGVSYRTVFDIEKANTRPSVEVIRLLCGVLEYPLSDFFKFKY